VGACLSSVRRLQNRLLGKSCCTSKPFRNEASSVRQKRRFRASDFAAARGNGDATARIVLTHAQWRA
jgi:hypothetical protein